ncbi:hypothetical protein DSO57_1025891 [Entomophthora muscae]|uniref:Uncharacterized protein n=1 Tax=Entomophthora muscae TaxID=34485 RepID=A0ACC2UBP2_9FUNG|nr:hypothetical protein DSO57_1025891 [Entomophthora muscae]
MIPASRPWALLEPILWWALSTGPAGCPPASSQEPPTGWNPDNQGHSCKHQRVHWCCIPEVQVKSKKWLRVLYRVLEHKVVLSV